MPVRAPQRIQSLFWSLLLTLSLSGCAHQAPAGDHWLGVDKLEHFTLSAATAASLNRAAERDHWAPCAGTLGSMTLTLSGGALKELYDLKIKGTYWSWRDMTADLLGAAAGALAVRGC
ncbi:hypothetical protein QQM79_19125 [Marinobacteraceae bacterium S3BR75-40.1]